MITAEMERFYRTWLDKANSYTGRNLSDLYDKAFTLFALYNRLYAEATFRLARAGTVILQANRGFPDKAGATKHSLTFIGADHLNAVLSNDPLCRQAFDELVDLIENEVFYIKLSMPDASPQRDEDLELLNKLRSRGYKQKMEALLEVIYSVRCNMFHGSKGYEYTQTALLRPVIILLDKVIQILYQELCEYDV